MSEIYEKDYPFRRIKKFGGGYEFMPGCQVDTERDDNCCTSSTYYTAHAIGKIRIEVIKIVEMPGKYIDRVLYKKKYTYPCGKVLSRSDVNIMTLTRFIEYTKSPFPHEYEHEDICA